MQLPGAKKKISGGSARIFIPPPHQKKISETMKRLMGEDGPGVKKAARRRRRNTFKA